MSAELDAAYAHCGVILREQDRERYFADLFAPPNPRRHLFALHAFSAEIAGVRDLVSSPMPGEIRLQWWRDAISGTARGDVDAHPVAGPLLDTIERFALPRQALLDLLDARVFDLYDDQMPTLADLEGYLGETSSALMRLGSIILADGRDPGYADAAGHAGLAYGLSGILRSLPWHARQGRLYLPRDLLDRHGVTREEIVSGRAGPALASAIRELSREAARHLAEARHLLSDSPSSIRPAFLPLALVTSQLARAVKPANPLLPVQRAAPLAELWRLWRGSTGKI